MIPWALYFLILGDYIRAAIYAVVHTVVLAKIGSAVGSPALVAR